MIDTHIHVVPPRLPGVGALNPVLELDPDRRADALRRQMQEAGVHTALAMGCRPSVNDPLGVNETLTFAGSFPGVHAVGVMDPTLADRKHLNQVDGILATGKIVALKGYLGYLHFGPDHPNYRPYYELAARHGLPVIFHTGDTYSGQAKLRFTHPLLIDEVAVDHPACKFVLAHVGNPWMREAAEVVYKNVNVWADLSGLIVGDEHAFSDEERKDHLADVRADLARAFRYAERPNRFLHGTDWPLAPMRAYRQFIESVIPMVHHEQIFEENARRLFRI